MAAKIACSASDFVKNTGSNSSLLPEAPVMIIAMNKNFKFTLDDLEDAVAFFTEKAHAVGLQKVFPMFGNSIPLDFLTNSDSADVTQTTDRGQVIFVQYGFIIMTFGTLGGGLCFARALQSFNGVSNMAFVFVDSVGRLFVKKNSDGTFSGMPAAQVFAPKITSADFKNAARTNFQIAFDPITYTNTGKLLITDAGTDILDLQGLIDLDLKPGDTPSTTTDLFVKLVDECCGDDVIATIGDDLLEPSNFIVTDDADDSVVAITGVTANEDELDLAGAFTSGHTYTVKGATSDDLFGNDVEGFDIIGTTKVSVP